MRTYTLTISLLLLLAGTLAALPAWGLTGEELERRVHEIADQLRCPTCQAVSVNDSEASFSRQIREKVRRMLEEGQNEEEIKAYFVSRYGEWILRAPKKEGLGLVLWLLPGVAILLVGGWIFVKVQRSAKANQETGAAPAESGLTEAQQQRIARDLKRFEEEE